MWAEAGWERLTLRCHHEAGQRDVTGGAALQRDGGEAEVTEHVHDGGEAQVLHPALPPLCQREAQVLQTERKRCWVSVYLTIKAEIHLSLFVKDGTVKSDFFPLWSLILKQD